MRPEVGVTPILARIFATVICIEGNDIVSTGYKITTVCKQTSVVRVVYSFRASLSSFFIFDSLFLVSICCGHSGSLSSILRC